jgi:hypothetical protein
MDEGLSFSDIFDDDIPYEQKPPEMLTPMEEDDFPTQAKNLFAGLWESNLLTETHLQDLFHATGEANLLQILKEDSLKLAFAGGTVPDLSYNKGYPFFLSTMRQKYGNYARDIGKETGYIKYNVIIHLDGSALTAAGFKVFPIDYWSHGPEYSEQEERVVSNKDEITPLKKFIKDIHVYIPSDLKHQPTIERIHEISDLAPQRGISVYFYRPQDVQYFKAQRTEKAVTDVNKILAAAELSPEDLMWKKWGKESGHDRNEEKKTYLHSFMRIYNHDYSQVNKFPDKSVMNWLLWYPHDAYAQLFCEAHNYKPKHISIFRDIVAAIKKEGVKTFKDLITLVIEREIERYKKKDELKELKEIREYKNHINEIMGLDEVEQAKVPGRDSYENWGSAKGIFSIYNNDLTVAMEKFGDHFEYYSNIPLIQHLLNNNEEFQKLAYDQFKFTHDTLLKYVNFIIPSANYRITGKDMEYSNQIITGRVWQFNEYPVVGFWQSIGRVRENWKEIELILDKLDIDQYKAHYTFEDRSSLEYSINDILGNTKIKRADSRDLAIQKLIHLSPAIKKAMLKIPTNRLQSQADKLDIPLIKLKQMLGSMDEMTIG